MSDGKGLELFKILCKNGWKLNPDETKVGKIIADIVNNGGHCTNHSSNSKDHNICPCSSYLQHDKCYCGLYIKKEEDEKM